MKKGNFRFKVTSQDKKTRARAGEIWTAHGKILTPIFVPVGTQGTVKSLTPQELKEIGIQVFFVNTYHLFLKPGIGVIEKFGGLHQFMNWDRPLMTDSGGFQVFSLGRGDEQAIKIDKNGVTFKSHWDGKTHRFTPEKSIEIQKKLGADIIFAFDECAPYPATKLYVKKAMERTHCWALRSLEAAQGSQQALFGIIQGGIFQDLRIRSAKLIADLPFDGIAIGGVSVGEEKEQMYQVCDWVLPFLPKIKPRHLLGVGEIDDIFNVVEKGVDMFDCVMPTRMGRMGHVLVKIRNSKFEIRKEKFRMDITKAVFAQDPAPIEENCLCFTCQSFSRAYINHLFRVRELLAYRLATIHNLYFVNNLVAQIRKAIRKGEFLELKSEWLGEEK